MRAALAVALLAAPTAVPAGDVYKCVDAAGHVAYQDSPCPSRQRQQVVRLPDVPPPGDVRAPAPPPPAPAPAATVAVSPPVPVAPPPQLYACVRATDGKPYIDRNGEPRPYLAPLGMLGVFQAPLAEVYGGRGGARRGMSAPELAPHASPGLIGSNYTWVQDSCRPLSVEETCAELQHQYDANQHALRNAFKTDQPPLLQREADLEKQLAGCPL
jgi:hypothetical protein